MSTTHRTTYKCSHCKGERDPQSSVGGSYCSQKCHQASKGASLLRDLEHTHTICASCFRRLKEIERPPDDFNTKLNTGPPDYDGFDYDRDVVIGYQYLTGNAHKAEKSIVFHEPREDRDRVIDTTGTVCECGITDPGDTYLREFNVRENARRMFRRLAERRELGLHEKRFRVREFVEAWNQEHDWAYALGRSIQE